MGLNRIQLNTYFKSVLKVPFMSQPNHHTVPKHVASVGKKQVVKTVPSEQEQTNVSVSLFSITYFDVTERGYMDVPTFVKWLDHFKNHSVSTESSPMLLQSHGFHVNYGTACLIISTC